MCLFCWTQRKIFWRKFLIRLFWAPLTSIARKQNTVEVNGAPKLLGVPHSSEYLPLCSAEQTHSYRSGNTWVNDDRIFIFGLITKERSLWVKASCPFKVFFFVTKMTSIFNTVTPPRVLLNSNLRSLRHFSALQPITDDSVELMNALTNQRSLW